jgi:hypothetical protein
MNNNDEPIIIVKDDPKVLYVCRICGTGLPNKKSAQKCFDSHNVDKNCSFCGSVHKFSPDTHTHFNLTPFLVEPGYNSEHDQGYYKLFICDKCLHEVMKKRKNKGQGYYENS